MTDSYIIFTFKMDSASFWPKNDSKSGLEIFFEIPPCGPGDYFSLLHTSVQNHKFGNRINHLPEWRDYKINFSRPLFTIVFRPKIIFLDTYSILSVKTIYELVK